jgi:hypothetical protein
MSAGIPNDILMACAGLALLLIGLVARLIWRRGRKLNDHPSCRKCGHDLFGLPESSARCPECGADLAAKKAKRDGVHEPASPLRRVALIVLPIGLGLLGKGGWDVVHNDAYTKQKPTFVLLYLSEWDRRLPAASVELLRRAEQGAWGAFASTWVSWRATAWQDRWIAKKTPDLERLMRVVEQLGADGRLSQSAWQSYLVRSISADVVLATDRSSPYSALGVQPRLESVAVNPKATIRLVSGTLTVNGQRINLQSMGAVQPRSYPSFRLLVAQSVEQETLRVLRVGANEMVLEWEFEMTSARVGEYGRLVPADGWKVLLPFKSKRTQQLQESQMVWVKNALN